MPDERETFIGRQDELARLQAALDAAAAGRGCLLLLSGEPGIGKTRTAAELAARAAGAGGQVVWGRCHEEAGAPPYWPWSQVLRELIGGLDDATLTEDLDAGAPDIAEVIPELRARVPGIGTAPPTREPAEARFRLFASLVRFLLAAARRRTLVVVLDDLHWADAPSLRFLRFLAPELAASRLLFVGTYRENELSRTHPLSDVLGDLVRVAHASRLRLTGLGAEEVRDFVAAAAGGAPSPALVRALHVQTEGNPLFLHEIVRYLKQRGLLPAEHRPGAIPTSIRIPEGVREVIGQRLNMLSPDCNGMLRVASVMGREFRLDVLARACEPMAHETLLAAVDDALDAHIIEELQPDRYQFTHTLIRMTLYDELRAGERRRLHLAVGEAIEALHKRDPGPVLPDLARHFQLGAQAGAVGRAVDYAVRAGAHADALLAFEDAASFFQAALDLTRQQTEPDVQQQGVLLVRLGEAQRKANDFDRARESFRQAVDLARANGLPDLLADAAIGIELSTWRGGYVRHNADVLLREALAGLPEGDRARRIKGMGALGRAQLYAGAVAEAKAIVRDAVALARELGDPAVTAKALSILIEFPGEPEETPAILAASEEMAEMARRAGDPELAAQALFHIVTHYLELGRMEQCQRAFDALHRVNQQIRQPIFFLYEIGLRASLVLMRGDLAEAERLIVEGLRLRSPGTMYSVDPLSVLIFALRREQGRLAEIAPVLRSIVAQQDMQLWRPGLALMHVELGEMDAAQGLLMAMAPDDFVALPRDGRWTTCLTYLAEVCAALGDAERAATLYRLLLPRAGRTIVLGNGCGCPGAADRFLGLLSATMGRWAEADRHYREALAINGRTGALMPLAHTRRDYGAMLLARDAPGDRENAAAMLQQARDDASTLGLHALSRKVEDLIAAPSATLRGPGDLTAREMEVLGLLAIGRTNADIALVLSIGVNTVATHVRSILSKTGCANRTEAAAYALRRGIGAGW